MVKDFLPSPAFGAGHKNSNTSPLIEELKGQKGKKKEVLLGKTTEPLEGESKLNERKNAKHARMIRPIPFTANKKKQTSA